MSFRPLWPAMPPPCLSFAVPGGKSSSSCTTRISSGSILKKPASICTGRPLAFMKRLRQQQPGAAVRTSSCPTSAWNFGPCAARRRWPRRSARPARSRRCGGCARTPCPDCRGRRRGGSPRLTSCLSCRRPASRRACRRRLLGALRRRPSRRPCRRAFGSRFAFLGRRRLLGGRHFGRRAPLRQLRSSSSVISSGIDDGRDHRVLALVQHRLDALRQRQVRARAASCRPSGCPGRPR